MTNSTKILYVDDEAINLQLFQAMFRKQFEVTTAISGDTGLEILSQDNQISFVISDMKMPGMNGIEFISKAKQKYPHLHYFILTGYEINDEIEHALNVELIHCYFQKPFKVDEISRELHKRSAK